MMESLKREGERAKVLEEDCEENLLSKNLPNDRNSLHMTF
jgi:hypothetical protein